MTYSESNKGFITGILKPYFQEAGLNVPEELFNKIVTGICNDDGYSALNMSSAEEYITQRGLSLLNKMHRDKNMYL